MEVSNFFFKRMHNTFILRWNNNNTRLITKQNKYYAKLWGAELWDLAIWLKEGKRCKKEYVMCMGTCRVRGIYHHVRGMEIGWDKTSIKGRNERWVCKNKFMQEPGWFRNTFMILSSTHQEWGGGFLKAFKQGRT